MPNHLNPWDPNYVPPLNQLPGAPQMGDNLPPSVALPAPPMGENLQSLANPQQSFAPPNVVNQTLDSFINGQYANNARRRGLEFANSRGALNGSIAGGASQRAALEAVQPFVAESMNLLGQRENRAFQGEQQQRDRNLRSKLQGDATFQQDWLARRAFSRDFNGVLAMMPINSAFELNSTIQQYALENPETYTPNTISGMTEFFTRNMQSILARYFPAQYGQAGGP